MVTTAGGNGGGGLAPATYDELYAAMATGDCTGGWDLICSYDLAAVNAALAANHPAALIQPVRFTTPPIVSLSGRTYTVTYDAAVAAPSGSFSDEGSGTCTLVFPLEDVSYSTVVDGQNGPSGSFDHGATLTATARLAVLSGDTLIGNSNDLIVFDASKTGDAKLVLHLRGAQFAVTGQASAAIDVVSPLKQGFERYVQEASEADIVVAQVPNGVTIRPGSFVIQPQAFVFQCENGVLSIYLQAVGSTSPSRTLPPRFRPSQKELPPIPQGARASIIVSKRFFIDGWLQPALSDRGVVSLPGDGEKGHPQLELRFIPDNLGRVTLPQQITPNICIAEPFVLDFKANAFFDLLFHDRQLSYWFAYTQCFPAQIFSNQRVLEIDISTVESAATDLVPNNGAINLVLDLRANFKTGYVDRGMDGTEQRQEQFQLAKAGDEQSLIEIVSEQFSHVPYFDTPLDIRPFFAFASTTIVNRAIGISFASTDALRFPSDVIVTGQISAGERNA